MRAIVETVRRHGLAAQVCAVIANEADAPGLAWASQRGLEVEVLSHRAYASRNEYDAALAQRVDAYRPHYVLLAGFMRVLTPGFVAAYQGRLLNIHPSLLPAFPGLRTHESALAAGVQWHGCTVHFVTPEVDCGPIVAQGAVPVLDGDTADQLAARVLRMEHEVYAEVVRWLAEGRVALKEGRVRVRGIARRSFVMAPDAAGGNDAINKGGYE